MKRRKFTAKFKKNVVLAALKERHSISELALKYELAPNQISKWKSEFLAGAESIFSNGSVKVVNESELERDRLLRTIGELKVENDFLKKRLR